MSPKQSPDDRHALTIGDLAKRWRVSVKTARRRVDEFGIPSFNVGTATHHARRWRLEVVEQWEREREELPRVTKGAKKNRSKPVRFRAWSGKDWFGGRKGD